MITIEEVREKSTKVATRVNNDNNPGSTLIQGGSKAFLDLLEDVPDRESAAISTYVIGCLIADSATAMKSNGDLRAVTSVMYSFGISLIHAANSLSSN